MYITKTRRALRCSAPALILAMTTFAGMPEPALAATPEVVCRDQHVVPGERIGQVAIGMGYAQVVSILGKPTSESSGGSFRASGWSDTRIGVHGGGVTVMFHDTHVWYVALDLPFAFARCQTSAGIRVGSLEPELLRAYGAPSGTYRVVRNDGAPLAVLVYDTDTLPGIRFLTISGTVSRITVFPHGACRSALAAGCLGVIPQ